MMTTFVQLQTNLVTFSHTLWGHNAIWCQVCDNIKTLFIFIIYECYVDYMRCVYFWCTRCCWCHSQWLQFAWPGITRVPPIPTGRALKPKPRPLAVRPLMNVPAMSSTREYGDPPQGYERWDESANNLLLEWFERPGHYAEYRNAGVKSSNGSTGTGGLRKVRVCQMISDFLASNKVTKSPTQIQNKIKALGISYQKATNFLWSTGLGIAEIWDEVLERLHWIMSECACWDQHMWVTCWMMFTWRVKPEVGGVKVDTLCWLATKTIWTSAEKDILATWRTHCLHEGARSAGAQSRTWAWEISLLEEKTHKFYLHWQQGRTWWGRDTKLIVTSTSTVMGYPAVGTSGCLGVVLRFCSQFY